MDLNLTGKRAMVCGSTQGIGYAAAKELASLGASVTLVARNQEKLIEAVGTLPGNGHRYLVADFSKPEELKETLSKEIAEGISYEILVNNTGGPKGGPIVDAGLDEFRNTFEAHLICNHILAQALIPGMKSSGYGRIINVISTSVKQPLNGLGVSNTIRGAVANWAKTMANELGQFNITVNNVLPGATHTARLDSIAEDKAGKTGNSKEDILKSMEAQVPMKRVGKPEELGAAIAFLASPAASYISGINLPVDGGRTACL
jgi:3-oxoacyl-[acyl-carrier protein] reductase